MLKAAALVCVYAAAWCSPALAAAAAAGGRADNGNFLDDKQWLTTISQYDKEVGQWNKFRDVSLAFAAARGQRRGLGTTATFSPPVPSVIFAPLIPGDARARGR